MDGQSIIRPAEVRAEGRRLSGTVLDYADASPSHRERFEPGAIVMAGTVPLNLRHDRMVAVAWHPGGGMTLEADETALRMKAELPDIPAADVALDRVRAAGGRMGLSVEFRAMRERRDGLLRVIEAAELRGIGIVPNPSYPASRVEARARRARGRIPYRSPLPCECSAGSCDQVLIESIDFDKHRDLIAIAGDYKRAIASRKRGTLSVENTRDGLMIGLAAEAFATPAGREIVEQADAVPIIARPIFIPEESEFSEGPDGLATYKRMRVKAILIGATDNSEGWPEIEFGEERAAIETPPLPITERRRLPLWLR